MYVEALQVILGALATKTLSFEGEHYTFRDVPIELRAGAAAASAALVRPGAARGPALGGRQPRQHRVQRAAGAGAPGDRRLSPRLGGGRQRRRRPAAHGHDAHHRRRRQRRRGAGDRAPRAQALAPELHAAVEQARHQADQRLLSRQFRRGAAGGLRHRRHARDRARRARGPDRGDAASTISSAASPSATWRSASRSARWSCSRST